MADVFAKDERSRVMRAVKSGNTKPELVVRRLVHARGFRFRLHRKDLPGKPDLTLPRHRKIIFVHGCFWHGHRGCKHSDRPASNTDYWNQKLDRNIARDKKNRRELKKQGWEVLIVWECETRRLTHLARKLDRFLEA